VSDIVLEGNQLSCALEGDPRAFLAALDGAPVADLTIETARLEDAFLELYEGESAAEERSDETDPAGTAAGAG
jgi:hypothetical protein